MNKMFFAVVAALPFIAGCWPFSKNEEAKQEMTEALTSALPREEANSSEEATTEDATQSEPESDEK